MSAGTRELEARIERERAELSEALADLGQLARERADVARTVREHPTWWIAGALAIGFWIGAAR